jgi:PAS domain S-box-containing protein
MLPLLVGALSLTVSAWLWQHEHRTEERNLRSIFNSGLRQSATSIEQRINSYEQMLRGVRGLFRASDLVTRDDFSRYVDTLKAGADFSGLRMVAYAPLRHADAEADRGGDQEPSAPLRYAAPDLDPMLQALGQDLLADPVSRAALLQARDSGRVVVSSGLRQGPSEPKGEAGLLLCLPLYAKGQAIDSVALRRAHVIGWVVASFRLGELMASRYGEVTPGLSLQLHDGVLINDGARMYPAIAAAGPAAPARFDVQEFLSVAGRTWTLSVRSNPAFEQRYGNNLAQIIAFAGAGLSLALALLTWQLVTGRERAQASARTMTRQLRNSAEQYRRIVETANEGIWLVDADARTVFVNPKLQQMLGFDEDALLGRRWVDFMDDASRAALADVGPDSPELGRAQHLDVRFRRKDGADLNATLSVSPIRDDAGRYAGALAMVTDITDRKRSENQRRQLESQLRQSQKMQAIGTLAGGIAHDFNNILAAILGNVAIVKQDLGPGHASAKRLAQIRQAGERGRGLVQQIIAFSRQQPQERSTLPLRPLLEEAAKLLRPALPAQVELVLQLCEVPLHVSADAIQLQQVLMHLCTNAWHAMAGGTGRIVIGLEAAALDATKAYRLGGLTAGRHAHVWVSDDGGGMAEATRLRIFEPFYTTKPVGKGTGLGLSVVHGIVAAHGGAIVVNSAPDQGSNFDIYLPLAEPAGQAAAPPMASAPDDTDTDTGTSVQGQGQHLLYVDDDPVMVIMVECLLQRMGYRVTAVDDPRRALILATTLDAAVDLVIADFNMPELSGIDLANELNRIRPELPVLIITGYVTENLRREAQLAGVRHVLQKEYLLDRLGELVGQTLRERSVTSAMGQEAV